MRLKVAFIVLCGALTSSCVLVEDSTDENLRYPVYSPAYEKGKYSDYGSFNYNSTENYKYYTSTRQVVVPNSYHVGEMRSPVSFQDRDQAWVSSQNPQAYTIELDEGEQASRIAQRLLKTPKTARTAQIKSERNGKSYYRGVYGSFQNAEEAQKALDALPSEVKGNASIKNWSTVQ